MKLSTSPSILGRLTKPNSKKIAAGLAIVASLLGSVVAFSSFAGAITVTPHYVYPDDIRPISEVATGPEGWYREVSGSATAEITTDRPYDTAGSVKFTVSDSSSYVELGLYKHQFASNRLADISALPYATWQDTAGAQAVSLQIGIDTDVTDTDISWQGRLVYEPYLNTDFNGNPLTAGQWQTWIPTRDDAQWWMTWSTSLTAKYGANPCPQADPCSYSEILAEFPDAGFNAGFGNPLVLKAGSGWTNFTGYADVPAVGTETVQEYWNFEPAPVTPSYPTTKEQCKNGGWTSYGTMFKNQGACVSYVAKNQ